MKKNKILAGLILFVAIALINCVGLSAAGYIPKWIGGIIVYSIIVIFLSFFIYLLWLGLVDILNRRNRL